MKSTQKGKEMKKTLNTTLRYIDHELWKKFKQKCIRLEVTANQRILDLIEKDAKSK